MDKRGFVASYESDVCAPLADPAASLVIVTGVSAGSKLDAPAGLISMTFWAVGRFFVSRAMANKTRESSSTRHRSASSNRVRQSRVITRATIRLCSLGFPLAEASWCEAK
jgi:hypothetical protein